MMAVYGLTGGIGAGKSTVCDLLHALGITVILADDVGRQVVEKGSPGLAAIVAAFGQEVLDRNATLDRRKLSAIIFDEVEKRRQLEDIIALSTRFCGIVSILLISLWIKMDIDP